jgi:hypothetical protein
MLQYMLCLIISSVMCLHAVTVYNTTPYHIKLKNSSMVSGKRKRFLKILKPGAIFSQNDIVHFTIYAKGKSHNVENLKNDDYIIVTWSTDNLTDDLAVEFYDSTKIIYAQRGQEVLCYDEERDLYYVIIKH